jgi:thiamine-phosphate pyrophosphorylase
MKNAFLKLMLLTHRQNQTINDYLRFIEICAKAGISSVQLREKQLQGTALLHFAEALKKVLDPLHIPLIINDHLELAQTLNADGLHLGQSDGCVKAARKTLGPNKIIGLSIDSEEQLEEANDLPIDYVGVGAIFPSRSKTNVARYWGLSGLHALSRRSKHPIIAIGGIDETNAQSVLSCKANGLAVIAALHDSINPKLSTENLRRLIDTEVSYVT